MEIAKFMKSDFFFLDFLPGEGSFTRKAWTELQQKPKIYDLLLLYTSQVLDCYEHSPKEGLQWTTGTQKGVSHTGEFCWVAVPGQRK